MALVRQVFTLAVAAALSWWVFLGFDHRPELASAPPPPPAASVVLTPVSLEPAERAQPETLAAAAASEEQPEEQPDEPPAAEPPAPLADLDLPEPEPTPEPPPAELGAPEGEGEVAAESSSDEEQPAEAEASETAELEPAEDDSVSAEQAMASEELVSAAKSELSGDVRPGFATVLLAAPEEQLDIARFFGEEIVLVPKSALDISSGDARYFRLVLDGVPRVESVGGTTSLEGFRQYRDLFEYEYARLPGPLRELRRSVLTRNEIYLFGALIPAREWAVVIQRRREALDQSGRDASETRRFVLEYRPRAQGGFDLKVEEIVFADGDRFRPSPNTN